MRLKWVVALQTLLILCLVGSILFHFYALQAKQSTGLLSPRVYAGLIKPKSYLILNFVPLKQQLQKYISDNNIAMSVYVVNLRAGASMSIDSNRAFPPASLSKVPVAILMMRKVEEGKLTLETPLEITDSDRDSNSGELYNITEKALPVEVLLRNMLRNSDNTAFKVFLHYLEQEDEELLSNYWDYFSVDGVVEGNSPPQDEYVTPRSVYNLFASLYLSTLLEPEHSEFILSSLTDTAFDINKEAKLPPGVRIAHKYGLRKDDKVLVFHDCGIMYIEEMRTFYCVMTSGLEQEEGLEHIGHVVHNIHDYVVGARNSLDQLKDA